MAIKGYIWIKEGAVVDRLSKPITWAKGQVAGIYFQYGLGLYITSGCEGNHQEDSLHYVNNAFDIQLPPGALIDEIHDKIIDKLGDKYDVLINKKKRIFHIEYDPLKLNF